MSVSWAYNQFFLIIVLKNSSSTFRCQELEGLFSKQDYTVIILTGQEKDYAKSSKISKIFDHDINNFDMRHEKTDLKVISS